MTITTSATSHVVDRTGSARFTTEPSATATNTEPAASTTPGYNSRLRIWFATTGSGRRTAWYYSWRAQRAIRVGVADAELWLAGDLADRSCGHPLKPHAHPHAEV